MYKTNKFRPTLVKQGPEPGLLWPGGNLCNTLHPAFCAYSSDFQNTQCANAAHAGCFRPRSNGYAGPEGNGVNFVLESHVSYSCGLQCPRKYPTYNGILL